MRDDHAQLRRARRIETRGDTPDLLHRHFAVLVAVRPRRVHAEHEQVRRLERGFQFRAEHALMIRVRIAQPRERVEERNVVIARNDERRRRAERIDERARRRELGSARALRDIARQHDEIGRERIGETQQRRDDERPFGAEMGIGNLQQHGHERFACAASGSGLSSHSGLSETRNSSGIGSLAISPSVAILILFRFFDGCITVMRPNVKLTT